jgi:hypothetical protein
MQRDEKYYAAGNQASTKLDRAMPLSPWSVPDGWRGEQEGEGKCDKECRSDHAIASVGTMNHADHDDVLNVGIAAWMMEIKRDEVWKGSSQKKIDNATQSAETTTGVAPMRAAHTCPCGGVSGVVRRVACVLC